MSPTDRTGSKQLQHVTAVSPIVTQQQRPRECVSPPVANNPEHQLSNNLPQHHQLQQHPQQLSSFHTSPTYAPQLPMSSPQNHVSQTSQASGDTSPKQIIPSPINRPHEPVSVPLANNADHQVSQYSPEHRHLPPYPQQFSNSHTSPTCVSAFQQPVSIPRNDVGQTSRPIRATSPKQMIPVTDALSHSRPTLHAAPMKAFIPAVEQHVYDRSVLNQQHTPVYHYQQYSQPADSYDRYRHHNATNVSHGLDPYRKHIPPSYHDSQSKLGLPLSDVDRMHPQITPSRSNSYVHKNKPTVQTHISSPQRDMPVVRNRRSQSGERMLSYGNRPNAHQQNVQLNDPYRLHCPAVDESNQVYHDRVGSGLLLSRRNEVDNRQRIYDAENANDNTAVRASGMPAVHGFSPAVSQSPQYSVPAHHAQQNSEVFRYPSPAHVVKHSAGTGLLPAADRQHSDLRNPLIESQYFRGRQVCTVYYLTYIA